ncbi:hypothetical protein P3S68_014148 [Capsicum galapagoense]
MQNKTNRSKRSLPPYYGTKSYARLRHKMVLGIEKNGYLRAYGPGKSIIEYFGGRPTKIQLIKQVDSIRKKSNEHVEKVKREAKEESKEMKKEMEDKIVE